MIKMTIINSKIKEKIEKLKNNETFNKYVGYFFTFFGLLMVVYLFQSGFRTKGWLVFIGGTILIAAYKLYLARVMVMNVVETGAGMLLGFERQRKERKVKLKVVKNDRK